MLVFHSRASLLATTLCLLFSGCLVKRQKENQMVITSAHELEARLESHLFFDEKPHSTPVSYLYAPGFKGTELMMGRYCPKFTAVTGEKVTWRHGGHTIGLPHSAVVFSEIDLNKPGSFTLNPIKAYINRIRQDLFPLAQRFFQDQYHFSVIDNPESSKSIINYGLNLSKANIGQEKDIKAFKKSYENHLRQYPDSNIILYGDSRGAATIFNYIAHENPTEVKAAILEGIFDDINHLIKHFVYIDKEPQAEKRMQKTLRMVVGSYNKKGPFPRNYAEAIQDDIPILFVTSLKDGLCCPQGTMYLYNRLRERGHKKIHLLVLKNAYHPTYMIGHQEDRELYESTVHAFYKHYGLPHNKLKAEAGQLSFNETQPTVTEVKKLYDLPMCSLC